MNNEVVAVSGGIGYFVKMWIGCGKWELSSARNMYYAFIKIFDPIILKMFIQILNQHFKSDTVISKLKCKSLIFHVSEMRSIRVSKWLLSTISFFL